MWLLSVLSRSSLVSLQETGSVATYVGWNDALTMIVYLFGTVDKRVFGWPFTSMMSLGNSHTNAECVPALPLWKCISFILLLSGVCHMTQLWYVCVPRPSGFVMAAFGPKMSTASAPFFLSWARRHSVCGRLRLSKWCERITWMLRGKFKHRTWFFWSLCGLHTTNLCFMG